MKLIQDGANRLIEASNIEEGTVGYLKDAIDVEQAGWRDTLTVRAPDVNETGFFGLPGDGRVSVIETRRTAFDKTGQPIRLTVSVYPADRNEFVINVGDIPADAEHPAAADEGESASADTPGAARGGRDHQQQKLTGLHVHPTARRRRDTRCLTGDRTKYFVDLPHAGPRDRAPALERHRTTPSCAFFRNE